MTRKWDVGKLQNEVSTEMNWVIDDFYSLPQGIGCCAYSPDFEFADSQWRLFVFPNGAAATPGLTWLGLIRLKPPVPSKLDVLLEIGLKCFNGSKYKSLKNTYSFDGCVCARAAPFVKMAELVKRRSSISQGGTLTIFCSMFIGVPPAVTFREVSRLEFACQTEPDDGKLVHDMKQLMLNEEECDVTFRVRNQEFRAHRLILGARTPVFYTLFRSDMFDRFTGAVDIEDCCPETFRLFLRYLYTGKLNDLSPENVFDLHSLGDKYQLDELRAECLAFMRRNLSVDTFCDVIAVALRHQEAKLLQLATTFFSDKAKEIANTARWQVFIRDYPTEANDLFISTVDTNGEK